MINTWKFIKIQIIIIKENYGTKTYQLAEL